MSLTSDAVARVMAPFVQHTCSPERRARRYAVKKLGIRQFRRAQYAARDMSNLSDAMGEFQ